MAHNWALSEASPSSLGWMRFSASWNSPFSTRSDASSTTLVISINTGFASSKGGSSLIAFDSRRGGSGSSSTTIRADSMRGSSVGWLSAILVSSSTSESVSSACLASAEARTESLTSRRTARLAAVGA